MTHRSTRRTVILATGAAALAAGCSKYGDGNGSGSSSAKASTGQELAKTSDIPVGGGKIFKEQKVVVTQPKKDEFKAFSAICTHLGCTVGAVADGTINCPCHGSKYRIADGSVAGGPAPKPLPAEQIEVKGNSIRLA
ncbi:MULTISPECIES: Rieske (2Fe-2S) protein [unclassified Streptomyces]|jgi:Rieske Fe-S protein|uniref:Rieske (2Fe-2S) protein n=1 Tax=unclassified Streptomyces TaxID=2593676 RepID=UPI0011547B50|nr:Rieske (2Fe-2S) protein [Streptomyces sp. SLBN-31]TQJ87094.1 Rieske-like 2Fe-2S protein [Streptomyces sp. SLBN-31]